MSFEGFPLDIGWELTLACNLRCNHCASAAGRKRSRELTTKEAFALCDQFPELLVQQVDFTGGEALLRRDWADLTAYLRDLHIRSSLLTNGMTLTPPLVRQMKDSGIGTAGISLDGLEDTHDRIRGHPGSFKKVLQGITLFQENNLPFIVITTVNSLNVRELPQVYHLLQQKGVRCWRLQPMIPIGRVPAFRDFGMDTGWTKELAAFIRSAKSNSGQNGLKIICGDGLEYIEENSIKKPWRGCPAGINTCGIMSNGKVVGCLSMPPDLIEGDVRKRTLWDIWFDRNAFSYNRSFTKNDLGANCMSCDKASDCRGGCSSCSYAATGHFHDNPYCYYRNVRSM